MCPVAHVTCCRLCYVHMCIKTHFSMLSIFLGRIYTLLYVIFNMNQRCQINFIFWWSCNAFGPNSRGSRHLWFPWKQGKSEGFDSCDWPQVVILLKLDSNRRFFSPCDLEIWWMTPQNNRASLLCYFKLFASFRSHWWIQTGVTVWKRLIWVKIDDFFRRLTLQFDGWPWKTIEHLFYGASSFVHHFVAISEFKLELQSGHSQFGLKWMVFF